MKAEVIDIRNSCYISTVKNYDGTTPEEDIRYVSTGFENSIEVAESIKGCMSQYHEEVVIDYIQMHYLEKYIDHSNNN